MRSQQQKYQQRHTKPFNNVTPVYKPISSKELLTLHGAVSAEPRDHRATLIKPIMIGWRNRKQKTTSVCDRYRTGFILLKNTFLITCKNVNPWPSLIKRTEITECQCTICNIRSGLCKQMGKLVKPVNGNILWGSRRLTKKKKPKRDKWWSKRPTAHQRSTQAPSVHIKQMAAVPSS